MLRRDVRILGGSGDLAAFLSPRDAGRRVATGLTDEAHHSVSRHARVTWSKRNVRRFCKQQQIASVTYVLNISCTVTAESG